MAAKLTWFPKPLAGQDAPAFARATKAAGLTRCNAIVRDKYPTPPASLSRTLRPWLDALADAGVTCEIATTGCTPGDLAGAESDLAALAEHGVGDVRLAQINSGGGFGKIGDVPAELDAAKRDFDAAAKILEKHRLRGVYQVHFKTLLPSPSSLFPFVRDLPERHMAVMLDPGNQMIEGHESHARSMSLFGPSRVAACGVKDVLWHRGDGGRPHTEFVPIGGGMCDWPGVLNTLAETGFDGHLTFMPFYKADGTDALVSTLAGEVRDLRRWAGEAGLELP